MRRYLQSAGNRGVAICADISRHFRQVSALAGEMMALIGDWGDMETMLKNFANRAVREKISALIDAAKAEDQKALEGILQLSGQM